MIKTMNNTLNKPSLFFITLLMLLLMIATRGHASWLGSAIHLPDFTLPALLIAGIYLRQFWVAFSLIVTAMAIDNYAIVHQGVSAHCITPAYSVLILSYVLTFWAGKFLSSLTLDRAWFKNALIVVAILSLQWLIATTSYYAFTASPWANFGTYAAHWSWVEIAPALSWMMVTSIALTLNQRYRIVSHLSARLS